LLGGKYSIRIWAVATFSAIAKAFAGCMRSCHRLYVVQASIDGDKATFPHFSKQTFLTSMVAYLTKKHFCFNSVEIALLLASDWLMLFILGLQHSISLQSFQR